MATKKTATKTATPSKAVHVPKETGTETLLLLDPSKIRIGENIRFNITADSIARMKEDILADGRINTPVEVQALDPNDNEDGCTHLLTVGYRRTLAAKQIIAAEPNCGLLVPARVDDPGTDIERMCRQISENQEHNALSVMDKAKAVKALLDSGVTKLRVRELFAAPGGRKGTTIQPASNSYINILLGFLTFPKSVQNMLNEGRMTMGAGMEMLRKDESKWKEMAEEFEKERLKAVEKEEKFEETILGKERRLAEAAEKEAKAKAEAEKLEADLKAAKEAADAAEAARQTAIEESTKALQAAGAVKDKDAKAKANQAFKDSQAAVKKAETEAASKAKAAASLEDRKASIAKKAAELAAKKAVGPVAPVVNPGAVNKAAAKVGATNKNLAPVKPKLNAKQMLEVLDTITKPYGTHQPKADAIYRAIGEVFDGILTPAQFNQAVTKLTGERK